MLSFPFLFFPAFVAHCQMVHGVSKLQSIKLVRFYYRLLKLQFMAPEKMIYLGEQLVLSIFFVGLNSEILF